MAVVVVTDGGNDAIQDHALSVGAAAGIASTPIDVVAANLLLHAPKRLLPRPRKRHPRPLPRLLGRGAAQRPDVGHDAPDLRPKS